MLDTLFAPGSVAVIGASSKELSIGNRIIKNLQDFGFTGQVYPINPKADEIRGIKCYGTISDVPGDVDLAHIVIPSKFAPAAVEDCGKKGVKVVIINSAGFREVGGEGVEIERKVVETAGKYGMRVFGPNCQGIINTDPSVRAYCNFTFTMPETGGISIVAQSGGVGEVINQRFSELGVGVRMYASNGNACDVSIPEMIEYWGEDDGTRVIVVHVESLSDPAAFMAAARKAASRKPVLGMKTGRTTEGAKAVSSHTGGLATVDIATELIFEKCGMATFRDEEELCQAAVAFATQPLPGGNRVGVITNTGGPAIIATDELVGAGLVMPPLSERAGAALREKLYEAASVNNPIDVLATGGAEHFRAALDVLMEEPDIDSVFINFVTPFFVDTESIAKEIAEVNGRGKKPVICNLMTDKRQWTGTISILNEAGVPHYSFPETAARSLVAMTRLGELRRRDLGEVREFSDVDREAARAIVGKAGGAGSGYLSAEDAYGMLTAYGIPLPRWRMAGDGEAAAGAASDIGSAVNVKVDAKTIVHKSDAGGVVLDLDPEGARAAVEDMRGRFADAGPRFLVQEYVPQGIELIVGAVGEGKAGHRLVFGLGGVMVEVLRDVSFGLTPLTEYEARKMISSVRSARILEGHRGKDGVDIDKLAELLQRVSRMVTDVPEIQEMDLNPVMGYRDRVVVVDARIRI